MMSFDTKRYLIESSERDYVKAQSARTAEHYDEARLLYRKTYGCGNMLSGVKLGQLYWYGQSCEKSYEEALKYFVDGMSNNNPLAAAWVAEAYRMGFGLPKDAGKSKKIMESCTNALVEMCTCGDADAQYMHGWDLLYGVNCEKNVEQGFYWLERAASSEHQGAQVELANCYIEGLGCPKDVEKGISLFNRLLSISNKKAHYRMGEMYLYGDHIEQDYQKALSLLLFAAERGHAGAQRYVGDIFYYGKCQEKDCRQAYTWYKQSADSGNSIACSQVADINLLNCLGTRNIQEEYQYRKRAADAGRSYDQYMMHYFLLNEEYPQYYDEKLGIEYLTKSASQGYANAQVLLGRLYLIGQFGLPSDDAQFLHWIKLAAYQGNAEAQSILGRAYVELGNDAVLPKSYPDAFEWLGKATLQDNIQAIILLAELYFDGKGIDRDLNKSDYYLCRAEQLLKERAVKGCHDAVEHKNLADFYD